VDLQLKLILWEEYLSLIEEYSFIHFLINKEMLKIKLKLIFLLMIFLEFKKDIIHLFLITQFLLFQNKIATFLLLSLQEIKFFIFYSMFLSITVKFLL